MARQARTKTELNDSTVIQPSIETEAPKPSTNVMVLPSDVLIKAEADKAFEDFAFSKDLAGSAEQRLAHAVMLHHMQLALDDKMDGDSTLALYVTKKDAREKIAEHMTAFFIGAPEGKGMGFGDSVSEAKGTRGNKTALLGRAMQLASLLMRCSPPVTFDSFNEETGTFLVPCDALVAKDETRYGRLAREDFVLLNNAPLTVEYKTAKNETNGRPIRSSVARFRLVNGIKRATPPPANAGQGEDINLATIKPEDLAGKRGVSIGLILRTLGHLLLPEGIGKGDALPEDSMTKEEWNIYSNIALLFDDSTEMWRDKEREAAKKAAA